MKGSLIVLAAFACGCIAGWAFPGFIPAQGLSNLLLYALMLQVGISIGCNGNIKQIIAQLHPRYLFLPLGTAAGTLLFSAMASLLLSQWSVAECMAVGSGFGYYSLSSLLITQLKTPSVGWQLAAELGTIPCSPTSSGKCSHYWEARLSGNISGHWHLFRQPGRLPWT